MKCSVKKFSEMYEAAYRDLYRYALCLMKDPQEAEDAVSEAVVTAYENIHKLKKKKHSAAGFLRFLPINVRRNGRKFRKNLRKEKKNSQSSPRYRIMIWRLM